MGCEEIRDILAVYAGGETYDNERIAVEAHVSLCAACARELDQYREARATLAGLREGEPPTGTWKAIWSGVRSDIFPRKSPTLLRSLDAGLRYAAVAMVGIALGVGLHWIQRSPAASSLAHHPQPPEMVIPAGFGAEPAPATSSPSRLSSELRWRFLAPRAESEGNFYLPRVESIPVGGEKDF